MDPIDRISAVLERDCRRALAMFEKIRAVLDRSVTVEEARRVLNRGDYSKYVNLDDLSLIAYDTERFRRCLETLADARLLARKVFAINFRECEEAVVFKKEACFSYACKMLSLVGPSLGHFSNYPLGAKVIAMELRLACQTPFLFIQSQYSDLICFETLGAKSLPKIEFAECNPLLEDLVRQRTPASAEPQIVKDHVNSTPVTRPFMAVMSEACLECTEEI